VFAKDSWEYHESGWNNVKSYGKVVIAQDSVGQWGPWEDFVEPAAGAPAPVAMPGISGGDQYRNTPDIIVIPEDKGCAAGAWCGYAIFKDSTKVKQSGGWSYRTLSYEGDNHSEKPYSPGLFTLMLTPDKLPVAWYGTRGTAGWNLEPLNGADAPNFANSGSPLEVTFYGDMNHFHTRGEGASFVEGVSHDSWNPEAYVMFSGGGDRYFEKAITGYQHKVGEEQYIFFDWKGKPHIGWRDVYVTLKADPDVAIGQFERQSVESYVSGEGRNASSTTTTTTTTGYYVAGIATPQSYLDSQRAGNVTANYVGGSFDGSQQGKVDITVKFAPGTWSGNWSQNGNFNFSAAGNVTGANISGAVVDTKNMSGTVNGTFYGQQAGSIGGVSDVTRTTKYGSESQAAIFLVNKVPTVVTPPKY
jgi:hypothetical protein